MPFNNCSINKEKSLKYLISPKHEIAHFWAKEMGIKRNGYIVINTIEKLRGIKFKSQVIYLEGKMFDYPEYADERNTDKFKNLLDEVEDYLKRLPYD